MGQYYTLFNLDKKQFVKPRDIGRNGLKMLEFSYDKNAFVKAMSYLLANDWRGDRVALIGDYAITEYPGEPPILSGGGAHRLRSLFERDGEEPYDPWTCTYEDEENEKPIKYEDASDVLKSAFGNDVENIPQYRYVVNLTQGVYIDREHEPVAWCWSKHDDNGYETSAGVTRYDYLPILVSAGDNQGGGDWRDEAGRLAGAWLGDDLLFTDERPADASELDYAVCFPVREQCLTEEEVAEARRKLSQRRVRAQGSMFYTVDDLTALGGLPEVEPSSITVEAFYTYQVPVKPPRCRKLRVERIGSSSASFSLRTIDDAELAFVIHTPKGDFRMFEHDGSLWRERTKLPLRDELHQIVKSHEPSDEITRYDWNRFERVPIEYDERYGEESVRNGIAAELGEFALVNGVLCERSGEPQYEISHAVKQYSSNPDERWLNEHISQASSQIVFASLREEERSAEATLRFNALQIVRAIKKAREKSRWNRCVSDSRLLSDCWIEVKDRACVKTDPVGVVLARKVKEAHEDERMYEKRVEDARKKTERYEAELRAYLNRQFC